MSLGITKQCRINSLFTNFDGEKSILVVDDCESVRNFLSQLLQLSGFDVVEAVNGFDALKLVRRKSFDLVLTDLHMPHMNGIALANKLREIPEYRCTPLLLLTSETTLDVLEKARSAGCSDWVVKPFTPKHLISQIYKLIRKEGDDVTGAASELRITKLKGYSNVFALPQLK